LITVVLCQIDWHGKVLTVDTRFSSKSALVVKDGKILAVGGNELAKRHTAATKVDLGGRVPMPGFMDTHLHITALARRDIEPDCETQRTGGRRMDYRLWLGRSAARG